MNKTNKYNSAAIILAAGKGTRMGSDLPKVLHKVAGRPMIEWVVKTCEESACKPIVVIGYKRNLIEKQLANYDVTYAVQEQQLGTGHAVQCAKNQAQSFNMAYVLAGDGPLIRSLTLKRMMEIHKETNASATLATSYVENPTGYGRILRNKDNRFTSIIEEKNANEEQRKINEIYPSYALFNTKELFECIETLPKDPIGGEYYITDVPKMFLNKDHPVELINEVPPEDVLSINTVEHLQKVNEIMMTRLKKESACL